MSNSSSGSGRSNMGRPSEAGSINRSATSKSNPNTSSVTNNTNRTANNLRSMANKERPTPPASTSLKSTPANRPADATTIVGSKRLPIRIQPGTNKPETIGGRMYAGHALDRMQGRGVYPSVVENAIKTGLVTPGHTKGRSVHYDPKNNIKVITNTNNGRVITTYHHTKR
jgi:hypothetical protein